MAFLVAAFDRRLPPPDFKGPNKFYRRFRNFMAFHYAWSDPDDLASEESHGRGMQAIGHACGYDFHREATKNIFLQGIPELYKVTSPRTIAHAMDGAVHFLRAFPEEQEVIHFLRFGGEWLLKLFDNVAAVEALQSKESRRQQRKPQEPSVRLFVTRKILKCSEPHWVIMTTVLSMTKGKMKDQIAGFGLKSI